jgi:hypothetical protein
VLTSLLRYFTGLKEVPVLPNYCGYTLVSYAPSRDEVLVGPGRGIHEGLFKELKVHTQKSGSAAIEFSAAMRSHAPPKIAPRAVLP